MLESLDVKVEYSLVHRFTKRALSFVNEKEGGFKLKVDAWGEFTIKVEIFMKGGLPAQGLSFLF